MQKGEKLEFFKAKRKNEKKVFLPFSIDSVHELTFCLFSFWWSSGEI